MIPNRCWESLFQVFLFLANCFNSNHSFQNGISRCSLLPSGINNIISWTKRPFWKSSITSFSITLLHISLKMKSDACLYNIRQFWVTMTKYIWGITVKKYQTDTTYTTQMEIINFNKFLYKILISPKNQVQLNLVQITVNNLKKPEWSNKTYAWSQKQK